MKTNRQLMDALMDASGEYLTALNALKATRSRGKQLTTLAFKATQAEAKYKKAFRALRDSVAVTHQKV